MALNTANLFLISQVGGPADVRHWRYITTDANAVVSADGYFDNAGNSVFNIGDIIEVIVVDNLNNFMRTVATVYPIYVFSV